MLSSFNISKSSPHKPYFHSSLHKLSHCIYHLIFNHLNSFSVACDLYQMNDGTERTHKRAIEKINEEVREWINGLRGGRYAPGYCRGGNSVVWLRKFSDEMAHKCDCSALEHALSTIHGVKRMIMGHTIQEAGINGVCDNKAIRIDVGMSKGCSDGLPEVLEIRKDSGVRIVTSNPLYKENPNSHLTNDSKMGLGVLVPPENVPKQVEVKA